MWEFAKNSDVEDTLLHKLHQQKTQLFRTVYGQLKNKDFSQSDLFSVVCQQCFWGLFLNLKISDSLLLHGLL